MSIESALSNIIKSEIRFVQHYGVVTAITDTSGIYYLSVEIAGSSTPVTKVRYLRSYVPRIGDTVIVHVNKNDAIVVGSLASAGKSLNPVAYRTTNQTITSSTVTKISFDAVENDDWNCWDLTPNPTRVTAPIPGRYICHASAVFEASNSGHRSLAILKNNTEELVQNDFVPVSNSLDSHASVVSTPETFAIGDYVESTVWHDKGSSLQIIATGDHAPTLSLIYLGP